MNWDAVIAGAEVVATVGVIITLIYLAIQLRQNSRLIDQNILISRATMINQNGDSYSRFFEMLAQDAELTDLYRRGVNGEDLSDTEILRYEALLNMYFTWLEVADRQFQYDLYFDEDDCTPVAEYFGPLYKTMLSSPAGNNWWRRDAAYIFTPSFYESVSALMDRWAAESE
jgi:hypothetical protein